MVPRVGFLLWEGFSRINGSTTYGLGKAQTST